MGRSCGSRSSATTGASTSSRRSWPPGRGTPSRRNGQLSGVISATRCGWDAVLFPGGVRLSTWIPILLFAGLAVARKDSRPIGAMFAWLAGFEAAYQAVALITGQGLPAAGWTPAALIAFGVIVTGEAWRRGVRPDSMIMVAAAVAFTAWVVTGFHANDPSLAHLNVTGEVLNEAAKTLWAVAYLVPVWRRENAAPPRRVRRHSPVGAGRAARPGG